MQLAWIRLLCVCVKRDPNSVQTLSAFSKGVNWVKSAKFTQQDIDEAKLSVFSAVDSPVAPSSKGNKCRSWRLILTHLALWESAPVEYLTFFLFLMQECLFSWAESQTKWSSDTASDSLTSLGKTCWTWLKGSSSIHHSVFFKLPINKFQPPPKENSHL